MSLCVCFCVGTHTSEGQFGSRFPPSTVGSGGGSQIIRFEQQVFLPAEITPSHLCCAVGTIFMK